MNTKTIFTKKHLKLILPFIGFLTISLTVASIPSETLIQYIGSDNAYLLMFILGTIGGLSTFISIPYHLILMSFASGGINPVLLGIFTGLGVMIGDSTTYLFSKHVQKSLPEYILTPLNQFGTYLTQHPKLFNPLLVIYGSCSPFSNDFLVAALSILGYSYSRTIIPLAIGNIIYNIAIAYAGLYAYENLTNIF